MELVKKYPINELLKKIMGKRVFFKSNCQFFIKEGVKGKVIDVTFYNGIPLFKTKLDSGRTIEIDGHMKDLMFEIVTT